MNKPSFRQRPIDYSKPLQLIKDINEVKKTADQAEKEEITIMESELKKILELYDRKKSIIIPKTEKIDKPLNEKNDKTPAQKAPSAANKFDSGLEYKQNEFIRPEHYIIYSERSRIENHKRDYEASRHDANFLNYENNFMTLEELEIVISTLENDIGHGELIPRERISQLILSIYPDKADYVKKLTDVIFIYNISLSYLYIIIVFFDKTRGLQKISTKKVLERAETLR